MPTNSDLPILIVDDETGVQFLLSEILSREGFPVKAVGSVKEALDALSSFDPKIIVTDIRMPGDDGFVLLTRAKEMYPEISIILITGHGDKETILKAMRKGAFDYIDKPFDDQDLIDSVIRASEMLVLRKKLKSIEKSSIHSAQMTSVGLYSTIITGNLTPIIVELHDSLNQIKQLLVDRDILDNSFNQQLDKGKNAIFQMIETLSQFRKSQRRPLPVNSK